MPERYRDVHDHPIVHECVHFLQHTTCEAEKNYICFNGSNYLEYVRQRCEYEAHVVQIVYIFKYSPGYVLDKLGSKTFEALNEESQIFIQKQNSAQGIKMILACKNSGLI